MIFKNTQKDRDEQMDFANKSIVIDNFLQCLKRLKSSGRPMFAD